jgi:hypothetical protein
MGQYCHFPQGGRRKWTKEEMMAYIDWDFEEVRRTDARVKRQLENAGKEATRRGIGDILRQAEEDIRAQEAFYSSI